MKTYEECKDEVEKSLKRMAFKSHPLNRENDCVDLDRTIDLFEEYAQSIRDHYESKLKEKDAEIERLKDECF